MQQLQDLVSQDASFVHRRVWTDPAVYALEQRAVFGRAWLFLGHESQISHYGDFVQAYMGETPVILARDEQGRLCASVNSCSHRGLPVCRADHGNTRRFVCPYHNWSYHLDGSLAAIPQERQVSKKPDKQGLGLKRVPRLESWRGLVFGSFDEDIESLESYLGDMRFYLDAFLERFPGGIEFMGAPHRWVLDANWKLPMENQLGDVNHGPYLHAGVIPAEANDEIIKHGHTAVTAPGHGATFRLLPEDAPAESVGWGFESMVGQLGGPELQDYLREIQARAAERVGPLRARMKGLTYGIYPNLSFLWSNASFKVSHPRGPGQVEYWSWSVVPADAPAPLKQLLRGNYSSFFGPGGILEQEDAESWMQHYRGVNIDHADDKRLFYGLGLGEEAPHPELPGLISHTANEFYARAFYQRWHKAILTEAGQA